jgi:hypothetical protein
LITGEYPPDHGGVADYTRQLAERLAAESQVVHVWSRGNDRAAVSAATNLTIHRVAGDFDRLGLRRLTRAIDDVSGPRIVFVQYVPHAFGRRAMNLSFCYWVQGRRRRGDEVRVMFHEVRMAFGWWPLKWNIIAFVQRTMAAVIVHAASKIYVSTAAWIPRLQALGRGERQIEPLAIPSNVPQTALPERIAAARRSMASDNAHVVGHFGTYGAPITTFLTPLIDRLTRDFPTLRFALLGRGSAAYRRTLIDAHPDRAPRITAFDDLSPDDVGAHIQAADVMLQPFPDGASFRRTSLMACLAAAAPTITTVGSLSEPIWQTQEICPSSPVGDVAAVSETLRRLLAEPEARRDVGRRAAEYYDRHFSLDRTIDLLLGRQTQPASHSPEQGAVVDR